MKLFTKSQHLTAAAVIMGVSILLSRIMGLLRDKVISWQFGAAAEADIYFAAFVVPDFINYLLAGGYV
ncbi:MAG: murein biosynthesis integral membrane protein MurJ, partial [Deltaproteobacteria bacterium]|nr:murein biosynthesis integral membrane protein MurJ [Deltaproteobacteria bacterium]